MSVTGQMVAEAARKYEGVPVVEGGRSREGLDCVGLVLCVAHDLGLNFPANIQGYGLNVWQHPRTCDAREILSQYMVQTHENNAPLDEVARSAEVGDVVLFSLAVIAITVGIVTAIDKGATYAIQKLIGGLHGSRTHFAEYDFSTEDGCPITGCYRFHELAGDRS